MKIRAGFLLNVRFTASEKKNLNSGSFLHQEINYKLRDFLKIAHLKEHRGMPTVEDTPGR